MRTAAGAPRDPRSDTPSGGRAAERSTRQKRALTAALAASDGFRSAQQLHAELAAAGQRMGLATVYSQLRTLAELGRVDVLRSDEGETLYRRCASSGHHHHLLCRCCGGTVEVAGPEVEQWAARVAAEAGFVDITHTVEVLGTCAACAARARGDGTADRPVPASG